MANLTRDISDFHVKFNLEYTGPVRVLPDDVAEFRIKFMQEELFEYIEGVVEGDIEKQFDALIDLVYVALGTAYLQGMPFDKGWELVQAANMAKVKAGPNGEGSKRGSPHDVIKPEGWAPPDHGPLLRDHGWEG